MRLRIRTLLLTVALLSTMTSTASASCLLDPFHWLFGCGCGPCYNNCGYGPPQGYSPGYGGYQPAYPGVMSPCVPCAPLCPIVSIFRMPRCLPMPAIFQQCLDPCGMQQCAAPMMQPAMMPYQPTMMPMMPQPSYTPPMMQMQSMDMGCDGGCESSGTMMSQMNSPMMGMQGIAADADCCGDDAMMPGYTPGMLQSWSPQGVYPGVGVPTRSYHASLPPTGFGIFPRPRVIRRDSRRTIHQYRRMNSHPGYAPMGYPGGGMMPYGYQQPMMAPQSMYSQPMYQQSSCSQPGCDQTGSVQAWSAPEHSTQYYPSQSYSTMPIAMRQPEMIHQSMMPVQQGWNPQTSWTAQPAGPQMAAQMMPPKMVPAQVMMSQNLSMAGDIMGDHEVPMSTAAAVPVVPNSFNGASPFLRASMSRPMLSTYSQYSKSVR